jgi:hypothetical protein
MATHTPDSPLNRLRPRRQTLVWGALLVNTELLVLLAYAVLGNSTLNSAADVRYWLYPFVWLNVSLWALVRTSFADATARQRRLAAVLAVGYFAVLAYTGGLIGGGGHGQTGLRVAWLSVPPGWGPAVSYTGAGVSLVLVPYRVAGYLTLAYLVYATVLDAAGSAVTGVLGLLSCVSCSWPVLASVVTGIAGSGTGIATAVTSGSYGISTVVFVATVALLVWRPFGD